MKRKIALFLSVMVVLFGLSACSSAGDSVDTSDTTTTQNVPQSSGVGSFDIETVRKSFIIKGVPFELPKRVGDLGKEWTYEKYEPSPYVDGSGAATFFYNGDEMFFAGVSDFENGDEKNGIIYDIALETSDCSIGGIIPDVTTKNEVTAKYGEPNKQNYYDDRDMYRYIYGVQDDHHEFFKMEHSQMFTVMFYADNDIVQGVRIVYTDLQD